MWRLDKQSLASGSRSGWQGDAYGPESLVGRTDDLDQYLQSMPARLFEGRLESSPWRTASTLDDGPRIERDRRSSRETSLNAPLRRSQFQEFINNTELSIPTLLGLGAATFAAGYGVYHRYFRRLPTAAHFTPSTLRWRRMLVGKVTSVGDADGFRLYHTPGPPIYRDYMYANVPVQYNGAGHGNNAGSGWSTWLNKAGAGKRAATPSTPSQRPRHSQTISIRLAGADAPELAHFGRPSQPFGKEAHDELKKLVLGKTVWCQIGHVDQYQRIVATPYVWHAPYIFGRTNVSLHLVKKGLATVYTQSGASYGNAGPLARSMRWLLSSDDVKRKKTILDPRARLIDWLLPLNGEARLKRAMARAKRRRLGIWSQKRIETPEEYKRRYKEGG